MSGDGPVHAIASVRPEQENLTIEDVQHRPRAIGVWGVFDGQSLSASLRVRVLVSEVARRRPDVSVRAFSAADATGFAATEMIDPIELLHGHNAARRRELAAGLDLVIGSFDADDMRRVPGAAGELLAAGPGAPARYAAFGIGLDAATDPKVIDALVGAERVSLLDDSSADHWPAAATRPPAAVLAHPAILAPRWFSPRLLAARREFLRALHVWPAEDGPLILQGDASDIDALDRIRTRVDRPVVVVRNMATDDSFADAACAAIAGARQLPEMAGAEDLIAAIAGATRVVAASPVVRDLAHAFGVPCVRLDDTGPSEAVDLTDAMDALDSEIDRVVALASGPDPGPLAWSELAAAQRALDARGQRLGAERVAFADAMVAERARYHELLAQLADMQAGYDDIRQLEVVRWRVALGDLRRRLRFGK